MMPLKILLAPHNDDEALFAAYTIIRERPLVVIITDSWVQFNRGDNITAEERIQETKNAIHILGCPVKFLHIRDDELSEEYLRERLGIFPKDSTVYAPAIQGGHRHHDLVGRVADEIFRNTRFYTTYTKEQLYTTGDIEVKPTEEEIKRKERALACYESQIRINKPHFDAVIGKSEWLI